MMDTQKVPKAVTPAKAGVQKCLNFLDSRLCGNDEKGKIVTFYKIVNKRFKGKKR